jgi:hypothetical protein
MRAAIKFGRADLGMYKNLTTRLLALEFTTFLVGLMPLDLTSSLLAK